MEKNGMAYEIIEKAVAEYSLYADSEELMNLLKSENDEVDQYIKLIIAAMFQDDSLAKTALAEFYYDGNGVVKNVEKAVLMYEEAYNSGDVRAAFKLGWHYYFKNDRMRSIEYFEKCINHPEEFSQFDLGNCYANIGDCYAKNTSPDLGKAISYLDIAVEKYSNGYSGYRLSELYSTKNSSYYDIAKAKKYLESGARNGNIYAVVSMAEKYAFGDEEFGIAQEENRAITLLEENKGSNSPELFELLGRMYFFGDSDKKSYSEALQAFEKVLEIDKDYYKKGYIEQFIGYSFYMLDNDEEAIKYLSIADANGYRSYSGILGHMYYMKAKYNIAITHYRHAFDEETISILGCCEYMDLLSSNDNSVCDYKEAYRIAEYGISKFNDVAFYTVKARLVLSGVVEYGITKREAAEIMEDLTNYNCLKGEDYMILGDYYSEVRDFRNAESKYAEAFDKGIADAALTLGRMYESGAGTSIANVQTAVSWYRKAANAGCEEAQRELGCFTEKLFGGYKRVKRL